MTRSIPFVPGKVGCVVEVADDGEDRVALRVVDSGPGAPADQRERIFEPFVTSKPEGEGTGLGLSISRGIVESANGALTCEPFDGSSCFDVPFAIISGDLGVNELEGAGVEVLGKSIRPEDLIAFIRSRL